MRKLIPFYVFIILFAFLVGLSIQNLLHASSPSLVDWLCLLFSIAATLSSIVTLYLIDEEKEEGVLEI